MRKFVWLTAGAAVACLGVAQVRGSDLLSGLARALNNAQSISATYTITPIGGASTEYSVDLSKPNMGRIEGPNRLVIANGNEVVLLDKDNNAFIKRPQTPKDLEKLLAPAPTEMFVPFFHADYYRNVVNPRSVGRVTRKGSILQGVQFSTGSFPMKQWTLYVSPDDQLLRQAQFVLKTDAGTTTSVFDTRTLTTTPVAPERFEWKAPADAKEISWKAVSDGTWFTDIDEAGFAAGLTNRLLFVLFYAERSSLTHELESGVFTQDEFKQMSESFIFCKIEGAKDSVFEQFKVTEVPTLIIMRPNGSVVRRMVGVRPVREVVAAMTAARKAALPSGS